MADQQIALSRDRQNPFDRSLDSNSMEPIKDKDDFGIFEESLSQSGERGIPVIVCGTANSDNRNGLQVEGGSIFNRLLRPLTPSDATNTQMETARPRLVLRDVQEGQDDDDDDLLCPETARLLPRDSSESLNEDEPNDAGGSMSASGRQRRHCHAPLPISREKRKAKIQLLVTSVLCFVFMMGEIAGGIIANSLALQTDAAHLATDLIAFLVSLFAIWASGKPATKRMSFGFHRIEVLGALFSIVMIWLLTGVLVFMAVQRIVNKNFDIDADAMLITAGCGVAFNIIMAGVLHADFLAPEMGSLMKHGHSHGGGGGHGHGHSHGSDESHAHSSQKHGHSHGASGDGGVGRWSLGGGGDAGVGDSVYHDLEGDEHPRGNVGSSPPSRSPAPDLVDNLPRSTVAINDDACSPGAETTTALPQVPDVSMVSKKQNINVRAAVIHVFGDLIQSIGVLIAAYVIKYRKDDSYLIADPICTFVFSILVLGSTVTVFRDVLSVLMEATPRDVDFNKLKFDLENIAGVETAHSLHVWCLTLDKYAIAVHLAVSSPQKQLILEQASSMLTKKYQIHHTTIQVEDFVESAMSSCSRCIGPTK